MIKRISLAFFLIWVLVIECCWADYSGLWWDQAKSGQGVSILQNNNAICGAWYLYDSSGEDMWLVFTGTLDSKNTLTSELVQYTGPALGTSWDVNKLKATSKGTVTLVFNSPTSATMQYNLNGVSGVLNLEPFANDIASLYWDVDRPGQGVGLFVEGRNAYIVWYLYDENGKDMWVTSNVDLGLGSLHVDLYQFTGPPFGSEWDPSLVKSFAVGDASLILSNSKQLPITYNIHGVSGQLNIVPFVCSIAQ